MQDVVNSSTKTISTKFVKRHDKLKLFLATVFKVMLNV